MAQDGVVCITSNRSNRSAPQIAVLLGAGTVFFILARRIARRWEFS